MEELKMRELGGQDLFAMLKILSKVKVKDLVLKLFETKKDNNKKMTDEELQQEGLKLIGDIAEQLLCNVELAKTEINTLFAKLCNVPTQDIENLGLVQYSDLLMEFITKEELSSFLKSIFSSKLLAKIK